jgi:hypothetical protein
MRKRYIQEPFPPYRLVPADEYQAPQSSGPFVIGDIQPYQSMVTGEMIQGRRQHREHLLTHGVIEVGNSFDKATPKPIEPPKGLKEQLIRAAHRHLR